MTDRYLEKAREILGRHTVGEAMSLEDDIAQALRAERREALEEAADCVKKHQHDMWNVKGQRTQFVEAILSLIPKETEDGKK